MFCPMFILSLTYVVHALLCPLTNLPSRWTYTVHPSFSQVKIKPFEGGQTKETIRPCGQKGSKDIDDCDHKVISLYIECDRGGVWKTILRQLNTADQSVWADSRASTSILYGPDFLPTPTDQLCSIGADSPPPPHVKLYLTLWTKLMYTVYSLKICYVKFHCIIHKYVDACIFVFVLHLSLLYEAIVVQIFQHMLCP